MTSRRILAEIRDLRTEAGRRDERANQLMAENRELMGEIREEMRLTRDEIRLNREVIRRNELAFQQGATALGELVEEIRAQTQAIFKLIDRLDGGAATA